MGTSITRRAKWQYPPAQPTPKILHLPRSRPRRKAPNKPSPSKQLIASNLQQQKERKAGKLESLFDQERSFTRGVLPVLLVSSRDQSHDEDEDQWRRRDSKSEALVEEEKWRFQAEMLRAECNLLRMERKIAVKKMERRRVQMERTLKSAVQTLLSGRKNICEGNNVEFVLEEQINDLVEKIEKLQKRSGVKQDLEVKKCINFDKQVSFLQRQLEKFGGTSDEEKCVKEIREMAEASLSIKMSSTEEDDRFVSNRNRNVEILRRKMEGLSRGILLEQMEKEYGSMLSAANSSASSSKRIDYSDDLSLSSSIQQSYKEKMPHEPRVCSGHCKAIVQRIVEQVRAETEQWSQMQEMLAQVRDEMEELQASRDFWEDRALDSDYQLQSLQSAVKEWRQKAVSSEAKANEVQAQVYVLQEEIARLRKERDRKLVRHRMSCSPINRGAQNETEKRILVCHLKENRCTNDDGYNQKEVLRDGRKTQTCNSGLVPRRSPLGEIGNMSAPMEEQRGDGILPLFCLHKEEMKRSF